MAADAGAGASPPEHLVVGHISKAHGTKGELFIWPLTDRPVDVFAPGNELLVGDEDGNLDPDVPPVVVEESRPFKRGVLLKLAGLDNRNDADIFARLYLIIPMAAAPPLDEGELFYHELLGMRVETVSGEAVGRVREVFETEPHHLLEVKSDDGKVRLIPFAERIVRSADRDSRVIVIDPPEGLLDL